MMQSNIKKNERDGERGFHTLYYLFLRIDALSELFLEDPVTIPLLHAWLETGHVRLCRRCDRGARSGSEASLRSDLWHSWCEELQRRHLTDTGQKTVERDWGFSYFFFIFFKSTESERKKRGKNACWPGLCSHHRGYGMFLKCLESGSSKLPRVAGLLAI